MGFKVELKRIFNTNQQVKEKKIGRDSSSKKKYEDSKKNIDDGIDIRVDNTQIVNNPEQQSKTVKKQFNESCISL